MTFHLDLIVVPNTSQVLRLAVGFVDVRVQRSHGDYSFAPPFMRNKFHRDDTVDNPQKAWFAAKL
jgi:hypothetical protein